MDKSQRADAVWNCYCRYLDRQNLKYQKDQAERTVLLQLTGKDFPMTALFRVEEEQERTFVFARLPAEVTEENLHDIVMATTYINRALAIGTFCVDVEKLYCSYESTEIYTGLRGFGYEYAERVIMTAFSAMDAYGELLFELSKGQITLDEFRERI